MAKLPTQTSDDPRVYAGIGYAIIVFAFVVLGGWAAITPLGSAVVATGFVTTEGNKKTIQHLEGGIIKEILIREGQHVEAGQVILRLDDTSPKANLEIFRNQLYAAVARETRLAAELDGSPDVQFPDELTAVSSDPIAAKAIEDQVAQFKERRGSLEGQISILRSREDQLRQEIEGLDRQRAANEEQINFIIDELRDVRGLYDKSLVSKTRWLSFGAGARTPVGRDRSCHVRSRQSGKEHWRDASCRSRKPSRNFKKTRAVIWSTPVKSCVTCATSLSFPETRSDASILRRRSLVAFRT